MARTPFFFNDMTCASGWTVTLLPQADYIQTWLTDELLRTAFLQQGLKGALIPSSFGNVTESLNYRSQGREVSLGGDPEN